MSAIWGMIHLDHSEADYNLGVQMEQAMNQYKLDHCLTIKTGNAVIGCGLQYITAESPYEQLPYYDDYNRIFYTADCMLDNRQELFNKLSIVNTTIPDGQLIYLAYQAWGNLFTDHVLGSFSLVIYDVKNNTCTLFADHTGSRSLYYCLIDSTIYFATVFAPLLAVLQKKSINEKWIAACELSVTPVTEYFPELTPFEQITQVIAGHYVTLQVKDSKIVTNKKCYWELKLIKKLKRKTQEEYRELFIKTLNECVKSVLRSANETGVTLSSGLDSSSVACTAAQLLEKEGKLLYSFTSVPINEYKNEQDPYYITDESVGVRSICESYSNIIPEFVKCNGKNACTDLKRIVGYLEFPHKSRQNMVWLDEIYERAASKGCKVVMKAQYGNATISQGKILGRIYEELKGLRIVNAYRQLNLFCVKNKVSRKKVIQSFIEEWRKKLWYQKERLEDTMVKKELLQKYNINNWINNYYKAAGSGVMLTRRQRLLFMYDMNALIQLGAMDTRLGLYHGIIIRDPLKDKRMIELCASYPIECYVQEGIERAAVRKYMRGIVPDAILNLVNRRGLQSADSITRLRMDWDRTKSEMLQSLEQPKLLDYIDNIKLDEIKNEIKTDKNLNVDSHLMEALVLCSLSAFLEQFGE